MINNGIKLSKTAILGGWLLLGWAYPSQAQTLQLGNDAVITFKPDDSKRVASVKRLGAPAVAGAPFASASLWNATEITPANWDDKTMGQIFGTAIDQQGNVYFAASAMYAVTKNAGWITALGYPANQVSTAPANTFKAGGAAGIYKASNTNLSSVSALTTTITPTNASVIGTTTIPNGGYGIGNIAVYNAQQRLYATNLEDGKIYSVNTNTGIIADVFDPFAADAGNTQIAPYGERLFAVAVNKEFDGSVRIYYSRLLADSVQNEIWSVQVDISGNFMPATNSLEIQIPSLQPYNYISDIAFSVRGEMAVAEKGENHDAAGYIFYGQHNAWSVPVAPALADAGAPGAAGGVDFANGVMPSAGGAVTVCDSLVWYSVNLLLTPGATWGYGYESVPRTGFVNNTQPAYKNEAHFVPIQASDSFGYYKTSFGDIEISDACAQSPTDICNLVSISGSTDTSCCLELMVQNGYAGNYFSAIVVQTQNLNISGNVNGTTWGSSVILNPHTIEFSRYGTHMPKTDTSFLLSKLCFDGTGSDVLKVYFIGNGPQYDTVCIKDIEIDACAEPVDTNCVAVLELDDTCINGIPNIKFRIQNNSSFTMRGLSILNINPDIKVAPDYFYPISDLAPGATSPVYTAPLTVTNNATSGCFYFSACDVNVKPGTTGPTPNFCCIDSIPYCITLSSCDVCDAINITAVKSDAAKCCYKLSMDNHYVNSNLGCMAIRGTGGTQFSVLSSWSIIPPVSSSNITVCPPGGGLLQGTYTDFMSFCLTGTATPPYQIEIDIYDANGKLICTKKLQFSDCELTQPTCANIVNDSMYCDGQTTKVRFSIQNNSPFPIYQTDIRLSDTSVALDTDRIVTIPPIAQGATAGPVEITLTPNRADSIQLVCIYLTAHNGVYTDSTSATMCCTDSLGVVCLPYIDCTKDTAVACCCCKFDTLQIPNGITPNNDGYNDVWVITNSAACTSIKMTVFNRWGNIVYKDDKYANNWDGTNSKGDKLPQGTYYIIIELPDGAKKAMYIDIRY